MVPKAFTLIEVIKIFPEGGDSGTLGSWRFP